MPPYQIALLILAVLVAFALALGFTFVVASSINDLPDFQKDAQDENK